ncbi:hypothetical protein Scep_017494 [Stephania cephalantha]|uniref:Uncharacterized protein n=1 Tax=Stephania cephalantha TaxID=152367 RepID=A0AAP0IRG0_9MAGN
MIGGKRGLDGHGKESNLIRIAFPPWCVLCLEVSEEPSLSRRSPALQSKMGRERGTRRWGRGQRRSSPVAAPELTEAAGSARQCSASVGESTAARAAVASQQLRDGEAKLGSSATLQRQRRGVGGGGQPADSDRGSRSSGGRRLAVRQWLRGADGGQELGSCAARRTAARRRRRGSDGAAKGRIGSDGARARRRDATRWDGGQRSRWWSTRPASSGAPPAGLRPRQRGGALSTGRMREIATTRWRFKGTTRLYGGKRSEVERRYPGAKVLDLGALAPNTAPPPAPWRHVEVVTQIGAEEGAVVPPQRHSQKGVGDGLEEIGSGSGELRAERGDDVEGGDGSKEKEVTSLKENENKGRLDGRRRR